MHPRFITLEGGEGVGKSTQSRLLAQALEARGINQVTTREPGGTDGAEAIRRLLLEGGDDRWSARSEALLFAAARADHVEKRIRPALASGEWVICDRFLDSSRAYQTGGLLSDDDILALHRIGSEGFLPDLTLLLSMPETQASERARNRDAGNPDRIGGRGDAFHSAVAQRFMRFAAAEPQRFAVIDASGSPEAVHHQIIAELEKRGWLTS